MILVRGATGTQEDDDGWSTTMNDHEPGSTNEPSRDGFQQWPMNGARYREIRRNGLIRQRSVVQVHLGPPNPTRSNAERPPSGKAPE